MKADGPTPNSRMKASRRTLDSNEDSGTGTVKDAGNKQEGEGALPLGDTMAIRPAVELSKPKTSPNASLRKTRDDSLFRSYIHLRMFWYG